MEQWRDIKGYEEFYFISDKGRVMNARSGKILKPAKSNKGYMRVLLCKNGKKRNMSVHRLVADAFVPNPQGLPEVNHINGNKLDNCSINLEWISHAENMRHHWWGMTEENMRKITANAVREAHEEELKRQRAIERRLDRIEEKARELGIEL